MSVEALISTQVIDTTTVGRALMTAVDASGARTTLGLGSLATQSGTFSGTSSGTNTGDQTIALTGDVTGTGTGSFAATIGALKVTNAMLAGSIAASKLVGMDIATLGTVTAGTLSTGAVIAGVTITVGGDATGDLHYRNASGVFTRLGIGSATQVLTVAGGLPSWAAGGSGAPGGSTTQIQYNNAGAFEGATGFTFDSATGAVALAPAVRTSGVPNVLTITSSADTGMTLSTESISVLLNLAATRQFSTGALTTQREMRITAPTYAFVAASTITNAATVSISGPPIAGTNATITNAASLVIESGRVGIGTAAPAGMEQIVTASAATIGQIIQGFAAQSANLSEWQLSTGAIRSHINSAGEFNNSKGTVASNTFIGVGAGASTANTRNIGIGNLALAVIALGYDNVAIGTSALTAMLNQNSTVVIGASALNTATSCSGTTAIGSNVGVNRATITSATLIGNNATSSATGINSFIAIGSGAIATAANQFVAGSTGTPASDVYFGQGVTNAAPAAYTINGTGGVGADIAGGAFQLAGGKGTGTGVPGIITFHTSTAAASSATLQTLTERMRITGTGLVGIGMTPVRTLDVTGTFGVTGIATFLAPITFKGYTVATLPAGVQGHKAFVTDALGPTYLVAVVGGGAVVTEVFYNGTAWVCT